MLAGLFCLDTKSSQEQSPSTTILTNKISNKNHIDFTYLYIKHKNLNCEKTS